jgi:myo-inositol-1(or 4)-monophosphatase
MPAKSSLITVMERAARRAAPQLRRDFGELESLQIDSKGPSDFVTRADRAAEATLREELNKSRPEYGFLLEEGGEILGVVGAPRFIIDPLDGTTNFLHGIPHFAVSIGVEEQGEITAGVVYNPITDETFWAEKGKGAWLGDKRLRVSTRKQMGEALFACGLPFKGVGSADEYALILKNLMPQVAGIRRYGAATLDLAWVAAGRFDGYFENDRMPWDLAAGLLLVREAGGFATDYKGKSASHTRGDIIVANPSLHAGLHKVIAQSVKAQASLA